MKTRILVTGASGFVGAHLAIALAKANYEVAALGGTKPCPQEVINCSAWVGNADLAEQEAATKVITGFNPDFIVHTAALANTLTCEERPKLAQRCNVCATKNILNAVEQNSKSRIPGLIYISTDLVFDGLTAPNGGFKEEDTPIPKSVYGRSKLEAENLLIAWKYNKIILRTSLVYGRKIEPVAGVLGWMLSALKEKKPLTLFLDEYRTPVFIGDLSQAIINLLSPFTDSPSSWPRPAWSMPLLNIAGPERISRFDFGLKVAQTFGYDSDQIACGLRNQMKNGPPRPADASLCIKKAEMYCGIKFHGPASGLAMIKSQI